MIKWRCCPELVQFYGFISVEVLLDTPPGSPKNCPEAKGGSVRVKISLSRPVSFFMVKPRFFPSQDQSKSRSVQSTPFKSSLGFWPSPLRSTSYFSPRTLDNCVECVLCRQQVRNPPMLGMFWGGLVFPRPRIQRRPEGLWAVAREEEHEVTRAQVLTLSPKVVDIKAMRFPLLEVRLWQEAKSNLVTVALGCKALFLDAAGRVSGRTGRGRGVNFVTLAGSSLTRHVALPNHGVGLDGCWLALLGCLISIARDENLKVEGVRGQTQTRSERGETDSENWVVVWTGQMGGNKTSLGKDFISIWEKEDREGFEESGQVRIMGNQSVMTEKQ
ncbi:hypothetical protein YC2023_048320 [Brassica napus]